jgi:hypothetical protein
LAGLARQSRWVTNCITVAVAIPPKNSNALLRIENSFDTFECCPILRIDAVTDLETSPALAPYGRFSSAVESYHRARNLNRR